MTTVGNYVLHGHSSLKITLCKESFPFAVTFWTMNDEGLQESKLGVNKMKGKQISGESGTRKTGT